MFSDFALMSSHCAFRRITSRVSSSSLAPSAAVLTITPSSSVIRPLRISFKRERSVSASRLEIPLIPPPGT